MKSKVVMFSSAILTLLIGVVLLTAVALAAPGFAQKTLAQIVDRLENRTTLPLAAIQEGDIWLFGLSNIPQPITTGANLPFNSGLTWSEDGDHLAFTVFDPDGGTTLTLSNRLGMAPVSLVSGLNTGLPISFKSHSDLLLYAVDSGEVVPDSIGGEIVVDAYTIALSSEAAPTPVGSFNFGTCGGGGPQPYDALYWLEAGTLGNGMIFNETPFGIVHSTSCDGIGVALLNLDTNEDIVIDPDLSRVQLSADRTQLVGVRNGELTLVDLATQAVTSLDTVAVVDQVAWGLPETGDIFYSSRLMSDVVETLMEAEQQQLGDLLGAEVAGEVAVHQVAIYRVNTETGAETEIYTDQAYAIGRMTVTPDNQTLLFSQIPAIADWYQGLLDGSIDATPPQMGRPFFGGLETRLQGLTLADSAVATLDSGLNEFALNAVAYSRLQADQPQIILNPISGRANTQVVVRGQGFPANTRVSLLLGPTLTDLDSNPYAAGFTNVSGDVALVFNLPGAREDGGSLPNGPLVLLLTTADGQYRASTTLTFIADTAGPAGPIISLSPISGTVNTQVNINGRGFPANSRINIHLGPASTGPTRDVYAAAFSDGSGNVSLTFNLPASYADGRPIQDTQLIIQAATDNLGASASLPFNYTPAVAQPVVLPSISLSPTTGRVNTQITVRGQNFPALTGVNLLMGPSAGDLRGTYSAITTDDSGNFETRFVLPAQWPDGRRIAAGQLTIVALTANGLNSASAQLGYTIPSTPTATLTPPTQPTIDPGVTLEPTELPTDEPTLDPTGEATLEPTSEPTADPVDLPALQLDPVAGDANTSVMISASGFPANTSVTIVLTDGAGQQALDSPTMLTDEMGSFEITYLIPASWSDGTLIEPGTLTFLASTGDGSATASAIFTLNVTA